MKVAASTWHLTSLLHVFSQSQFQLISCSKSVLEYNQMVKYFVLGGLLYLWTPREVPSISAAPLSFAEFWNLLCILITCTGRLFEWQEAAVFTSTNATTAKEPDVLVVVENKANSESQKLTVTAGKFLYCSACSKNSEDVLILKSRGKMLWFSSAVFALF